MSPQADRQEAGWTGKSDRPRGRDRRRYRHDSPPFGHASDPDPLPLPRRRGGGDTRHPRRPPAAAKACATACNAAQPGSIASTSWPDRLRSRGGSRSRDENEAAFCTDRPAGDAGQLCNGPRLSGASLSRV